MPLLAKAHINAAAIIYPVDRGSYHQCCCQWELCYLVNHPQADQLRTDNLRSNNSQADSLRANGQDQIVVTPAQYLSGFFFNCVSLLLPPFIRPSWPSSAISAPPICPILCYVCYVPPAARSLFFCLLTSRAAGGCLSCGGCLSRPRVGITVVGVHSGADVTELSSICSSVRSLVAMFPGGFNWWLVWGRDREPWLALSLGLGGWHRHGGRGMN